MKNNNNFLMGEIPNFHPKSLEYFEYWRQEKRSCIEGLWGQGYWMPGNLYFYVNHWHILLNTDNFSKAKSLAKPFCRDLEWQKAYIYAEARGFSGFRDDEEVTCFRLVKEFEEKLKAPGASKDKLEPSRKVFPKECFKPDGTLKKYQDARSYLNQFFSKHLGKPLYQNEAKNVVDIECRGSGKDLINSTLLHRKDGSRYQIKDVRVGDFILGRDGKETKVTQRRDFSDQMQYEVSFASGKKVTCGGGHLWTVSFRGKTKTVELNDIKDDYYWNRSNGVKDYKYAVPIAEAIEYSGDDPDIEPYYFGLWLGDGNKHNTGITTMDPQTIEYLETVRVKEGMSTLNVNRKPGNKAATYLITNGGKGGNGGLSNPLKNKLRDLGVLNNKHIPNSVLFASVDYRMSVLQGLMDSDGYIGKGHIELTTSYKGIQDTVLKLIGGLGIKYNARIKKTTHADTLRISLLTNKQVFRLKRKASKVNLDPPKITRSRQTQDKIVGIKEIGVHPSVCIAVDNEDSLFIVDDIVVTHNSYWAAGGMIAHNFLFDGAVDYDEYLAAAAAGKFMSSETLVGAISTSYSADLLSKVALGLESLLGGQHLDDGYYPSPLSKKTSGTLAPGKNPLVAKYKKDFGGSWKEVGSMSKIHHRSFKDKPTAGNGTRPGLTILEEVGFMGNLRDALGPLKQCTLNGSTKFGTIYMFGTGGDMDGGATEAVRDVFYDPDAWDCLVFDDVFENRGKIGYFVPYAYGLNQFKDDQGNTDLEEAQGFVDQVRYDLSQKKSKKPLNMEMQDNPNVPSEAFLVSTGNVFPIAELQDQLGWLESIEGQALSGQHGWIVPSPNTPREVKWVPDLKNDLTPCTYPTEDSDDTDGCHVIWEHPPAGNIPHGMYLAGTDPYDQDRAPNSNSLGSTFIYKVGDIRESGSSHMIVAEYTARPEKANDHHEEVRKLLTYYNAQDLYENERNSIKMYFEAKNCLHLLTKQPDILKATERSQVQRGYGTHMTIQIKEELELYARDWLTTSIGNNMYRYHLIFSIPLLKELIAYNKDGNFDRVIAFLLCIYNQMQNHHVKVVKVRDEIERDPFFDDDDLF